MKSCRKCDAGLVEGKNWHPSCVKYGNYICIRCRNAYQHQYRESHHEEIAAYQYQWREAHPEYQRQWDKANPEKRRRRNQQWNEANQERRRELGRQYRESHREQYAAYQRKWYRDNRDYYRQYYEAHKREKSEYNQRWREAHEQERREYRHRWSKANREKTREYTRRYRARKKNAAVGPVDEMAIYERDGRKCIYCPSTTDLTLDHLVPLSRDGAHSQDNLAVACRSCNSRKGAKTYKEFVSLACTQGEAR